MGCGLSRGPANGSGDATTPAGAVSSAVTSRAAPSSQYSLIDQKMQPRHASTPFDTIVQNAARTAAVAKQGRSLYDTATSSFFTKNNPVVSSSKAARLSEGFTVSLTRLNTASEVVNTSASVQSSKTTSSSSKTAKLRNRRAGHSTEQTATDASGTTKMASDSYTKFSIGSETANKQKAILVASQTSNRTTASLKSSDHSKREKTSLTASTAPASPADNSKPSSKAQVSGASRGTNKTLKEVTQATKKSNLSCDKASTSASEIPEYPTRSAKDTEVSNPSAKSTIGKKTASSPKEKTATASSSKISSTLSRLTKTTESFASKTSGTLKHKSRTSERTENVTALSLKSSRTANHMKKASESVAGIVFASTSSGTSIGFKTSAQQVSISEQENLNSITTFNGSTNAASLSSKNSRTASRLTMASVNATKSHTSSKVSTPSTRSKTSAQISSLSAQSAIEQASSKTSVTLGRVRGHRVEETSDKSRTTKLSLTSAKSSNTTNKTSQISRASSQLSRELSVEAISAKSRTSKEKLLACSPSSLATTEIDDGTSSEVSNSESTLVPSVLLRSSTTHHKATPVKSLGTPLKSSRSAALNKSTLKKAQIATTGHCQTADTSRVSADEPKESVTSSPVPSSSENTFPPTCTASSWEPSVASSVAATPLGHRRNSVRFINCDETSHSIDVADDREDFFFRPASWSQTKRTSSNGTLSSSAVILNVRRAMHSTMSADEAYEQYWCRSWKLPAMSDSETSISDDDGRGQGDAPPTTKTDGGSTKTASRSGCDDGATKTTDLSSIGDAPSSATVNSCGERSTAKVLDNRETYELSESKEHQRPPSIVDNINNSAVVGLAGSETWDPVSGTLQSRPSSSLGDCGALSTTSSLVLNGASVIEGELHLQQCCNKELDPEMWDLHCQRAIDEYEIRKRMSQNPASSCDVGFRSTLNKEVGNVKNYGAGTPFNNIDNRQGVHNTQKNIVTLAISEKVSTVMRSLSFSKPTETVNKVETLTRDFVESDRKKPVHTFQQSTESQRFPMKAMMKACNGGVIAWQQPIAQLTGNRTSGVKLTYPIDEDIWTDDIDDTEFDSGYASRTTLSELIASKTSKPSSPQLEQILQKAIISTAQLQNTYKPEIPSEKYENVNSIDDEEISESVEEIEYHAYDDVASHEHSENPNSIEDSACCVSPSTERSVPSPTVDELNVAAKAQCSNTFSPLGPYTIDTSRSPRDSDQTVKSEAITKDASDYAYSDQTAQECNKCTLNRAPVGRLKIKNDGLIAELTKWWQSSAEKKNIPPCSQAICLRYDFTSDGEPPTNDRDSLTPQRAASVINGDKLSETAANGAIEQDSRDFQSQKSTAHELRPASQMAQQHLGLNAVGIHTPSTASCTSVRTLTPSQRSRSPGCYLSPQEAASLRGSMQSRSPGCYLSPQGASSLRTSTPSRNETKSGMKLELGTPERGSSQASTAIVSPPRSSPSGDERPSSRLSINSRDSPLPTHDIHGHRTPPSTSPVLRNMIRELSELQLELRARIVAAEAVRANASHSAANPTGGLISEMEAADLESAMTSANTLAEKLCSLVRQRTVKGIETGAGCARHVVNVTTTTTTDISVSVDKGPRRNRFQSRSPPASSKEYPV